jgi:hypothetical protein
MATKILNDAEFAMDDLDGCLSRASALALAISDGGVLRSIATFAEAETIMSNLHWLLSEEIIRAQDAFTRAVEGGIRNGQAQAAAGAKA